MRRLATSPVPLGGPWVLDLDECSTYNKVVHAPSIQIALITKPVITNSRHPQLSGKMYDLQAARQPVCYFSIPVAATHSHYSDETPTPQATPSPEYCPDTWASPTNPLLAHRSLPMASPGADASRLLQLQTQAAHRPSTQPLQSPSPSNSDSSMSQRSSIYNPLCCCRCRRESHGHSGMFQFGTNLYYCSHCAKMVGYSAG